MKRIIFIIMILFSGIKSHAQILEWYEEIKDKIAAAKIEVIAGLEEAGNAEKAEQNKKETEKTKELIKQKETLEEIQDLLNDISDALRTYSALKNCLMYLKATAELYTELSRNMRRTTSDGNKILNSDDIVFYNNYMFSILKRQKENLNDLKIITSKKVNMTEGQRIKLIYGVENKMRKTYLELNRFKNLFIY